MMIQGAVWRFGDNIDTDVIIPARHLSMLEPDDLARHCMEDIDPHFANAVQPGDLIVAGENFGCGSSREHAPLAIKASGVSCVVASSFARIFYRNAINVGLPILECPAAAREVQNGQRLRIDLVSGQVQNLTTGTSYQSEPYPRFMRDIIDAGGLVPFTQKRIESGADGATRTYCPSVSRPAATESIPRATVAEEQRP
jgi:3-isopropylmalate/(R)-2-methylmalate dehydratase small subunit